MNFKQLLRRKEQEGREQRKRKEKEQNIAIKYRIERNKREQEIEDNKKIIDQNTELIRLMRSKGHSYSKILAFIIKDSHFNFNVAEYEYIKEKCKE